MFGINRALATAGWGTSGPKFRSTTAGIVSISGALDGAGSWSWSAGEYLAGVSYQTESFFPSQMSGVTFDQSNLVSKTDFTVAATIRFPTAANVVFRPQGDVRGLESAIDNFNSASFFGAYAEIYNMGGYPYGYWQILPQIVADGAPEYIGTPGQFSLLIQGGGSSDLVLPITWDELADRWITVIISQREGEFYNDWTGGDINYAFGTPRYLRVVIVDAETKQILVRSDSFHNEFKYANDNYRIDFSGKTVALNTGDPDASNFTFRSRVEGYKRGTTPGYNTDLLKTASGWFSLGEAVDPLQNDAYKMFTTHSIPATINNVRAWVNLGSVSATDDGTDTTMLSMRPARASVPGNVWGIREDDVGTADFFSDLPKI